MTPSEPMLPLKCPRCGFESRVPAHCAGLQTVCPKCSSRRLVARPVGRATPPPRPAAVRPSAGPPLPKKPPPALGALAARVGGWLRRLATNRAYGAIGVVVCLALGVVAVGISRPSPKPLVTEPTAPGDGEAAARDADMVRGMQRHDSGAESTKTADAATGDATGEARFSRTLQPPRPPEELRTGLASLRAKLESLGVRDSATEREAALVKLRMYRYLCGLNHAELVLDERLNDEAVAAADICRQLGRLTHTPENPGMAPDDYARACRGASSGNLASGISNLVRAVDGWMDDSDAANIDVLGHRRWCLFPPLQRVGFGRTGGWCAMWAHDDSGTETCSLPAICYPPPGLVPIDLFRPNHAWSVSLNPRFYRRPRPGEIRLQVRDSGGEALVLEKETLETKGYGIDNCIIFRPRDLATTVGARYVVTISGVRDHDERAGNLSYEVEFFAE
jgi:hypothetical protein